MTHRAEIAYWAKTYGWRLRASEPPVSTWDEVWDKGRAVSLRVSYTKNDLVKDAEFEEALDHGVGTLEYQRQRVQPRNKMDQILDVIQGPKVGMAEVLGLTIRRPS